MAAPLPSPLLALLLLAFLLYIANWFSSSAAASLPSSSLLAPSPLTPTIPKLSGNCPLNFTALERMMMVTSTDCMAGFALPLANAVCCPQLEATLVILIGQSSRRTNTLSLNETLAHYCLLDYEQSLVAQGATDSLPKICSIGSYNLTKGSCPVTDVSEFERTVNPSKILAACGSNLDECVSQNCQKAIIDAAKTLSEKAGSHTDHSGRVNDCQRIVLRWIASKFESSQAKDLLQRLSSCRINKVCPLNFPSISSVIQGCGNQTGRTCCGAIGSYLSDLQRQSLLTNLQAMTCATSLGVRLRKKNITTDLYSQCNVTLRDFSLQDGSQESGCLLSSFPTDFVVKNMTASGAMSCGGPADNFRAPWPATPESPFDPYNKKNATVPTISTEEKKRVRKRRNILFFCVVAIAVLIAGMVFLALYLRA